MKANAHRLPQPGIRFETKEDAAEFMKTGDITRAIPRFIKTEHAVVTNPKWSMAPLELGYIYGPSISTP